MTIEPVNWRECERQSWAPESEKEMALTLATEKLAHIEASLEALYIEAQLARTLIRIHRQG